MILRYRETNGLFTFVEFSISFLRDSKTRDLFHLTSKYVYRKQKTNCLVSVGLFKLAAVQAHFRWVAAKLTDQSQIKAFTSCPQKKIWQNHTNANHELTNVNQELVKSHYCLLYCFKLNFLASYLHSRRCEFHLNGHTVM